ncbi:MAG: hypothetical protein NTZ12_10380 [Candidatus Aminicenantes bacterium]|nr:hypothetical protein [Candidatus Aminicenantes bacterium]
MKKFFLLGLIAVMAFIGYAKTGTAESAQTAAVGPFDGSFGVFKSAAAGKDYSKALAALRSLMLSFLAESPLLLEHVRFVKGADNSYGIFSPRENDLFAAAELIYVYMEPAGYVLNKNPAGYYEFGFKADFQVTDAQGKILGGQTDFAVLPFKSWNSNTEISLTFTYTLSGLEKGKYKLITQVRDAYSPKKASCEKWFTIE